MQHQGRPPSPSCMLGSYLISQYGKKLGEMITRAIRDNYDVMLSGSGYDNGDIDALNYMLGQYQKELIITEEVRKKIVSYISTRFMIIKKNA